MLKYAVAPRSLQEARRQSAMMSHNYPVTLAVTTDGRGSRAKNYPQNVLLFRSLPVTVTVQLNIPMQSLTTIARPLRRSVANGSRRCMFDTAFS